MFLRSSFLFVSRCSGVQRAVLCRNISTIVSKPIEKGTYHANIFRAISAKSSVMCSSIPNSDSKNQDHNIAQPPIPPKELQDLTRAQKLKKAVTEYGTTVIVFHVGISLISLGSCYLVVSSGLDIDQLLVNLGLTEWVKGNTTLVSNAGTFAVSYAVHKIFAPVRISITLASVPFIVRYLRRKGILKK